jgi:hypothetical protein
VTLSSIQRCLWYEEGIHEIHHTDRGQVSIFHLGYTLSY